MHAESRAMNERTFTLDAPDGHPISVSAWLPEGEPSAVIQIAHGMAEHAGRYTRLAHALVARGWAVYANDHRGHGRSIPAGQAPGHLGLDGFTHAASVVRALARRIEEEHPSARRILLGHSFGSFLVQRLLYTEPGLVSAAVLSASNGKPPPLAAAGRYIARLERLRLGAEGKSKLIDQLTFKDFNRRFKPNRTDFDWISSDEAEVDAYRDDPMCGFVLSVQSWIDLLDALDSLTAKENLARIPRDLPIYLFAGTKDPVGDFGRGVERLAGSYRAAGLRRVELRLYPGGRHEMLHEKNADEVIAELIAWIERAIAS